MPIEKRKDDAPKHYTDGDKIGNLVSDVSEEKQAQKNGLSDEMADDAKAFYSLLRDKKLVQIGFVSPKNVGQWFGDNGEPVLNDNVFIGNVFASGDLRNMLYELDAVTKGGTRSMFTDEDLREILMKDPQLDVINSKGDITIHQEDKTTGEARKSYGVIFIQVSDQTYKSIPNKVKLLGQAVKIAAANQKAKH